MPRSKLKVFKKRNRIFTGRRVHSQSEVVSDVIDSPNLELQSRPNSSNVDNEVGLLEPTRTSSSGSKINSNLDAYSAYIDCDNIGLNDCYDMVSLQTLQNLISQIAVCVKCQGPLSLYPTNRLGLSFKLNLKCSICNYEVSEKNSPAVNKKSAINVRLAYAFRCIGKGEEAARNFCGLMNLPNPPEFKRYNKILIQATKEVATDSMKKAVEDSVGLNENGCRDITAIFDGSWQRRGHASQNGIVSAISGNNGKVIDVRIFTKYCRCSGRLNNEHDTSCIANYSGTSGRMESTGILDMFTKSESTYNIRYKYFLGDGDSSAYPTVVAAKPYGEFNIEKLECVGHIQKRMGTRLRKLKQSLGKNKLDDGKTLGGRGRLTHAAINEIQNYYGLAIRRNVHSLESMKAAVWAEYFHLSSSNDSPMHELCPKGTDSWCKYQRAKSNNESYDHDNHTHYSSVVMTKIKPIFKDLANPDLLRKCLHGGTQNASESLNSVIWSRIPKSTFVLKNSLELGVFDAISTYNEGNIARCQVLDRLGIRPGSNCAKRMKRVDELRVKKAEKAIQEIEKKCRQKKTMLKQRLEDQYEMEEDPDNPSYGAGMY